MKSIQKGWHMNCLENFYIQMHQQQGKLIKEQNFGELNSLFGIT